jgi:predicted Zn-dependent peptidase
MPHVPHRPARALLLGALLLALAAPAAAQPLLAQFEPLVTEFTLDNGMTFIVVERREAPVVSFFTYADVGSVDEPSGQTGVAHMFEHMAFKGTTSLGTRDLRAELGALAAEEAAYLALRTAQLDGAPAAEVEALTARFVHLRDSAKTFVDDAAFDGLLTRNGAVGLNAFTSADQTGYFYSLPSNKLELWFATESDRFARPVQREFYQERDVVMEERRLRTESNPTGRLFEEFLTTAFKAHPYGQPVVGHLSDLQSLSRTDAQAFFERYYGVSNLTVAIVGDVDSLQARTLAERYFAPIPGGTKPDRIRTVEPPQLGERRVTLEDRAQPFVFMGFHRPAASHPDAPVYTVLADILNAGRTSRFHRALVETRRAVGANVIEAFPGEKYPSLVTLIGVPAPGVDPDTLAAEMSAVLDEIVANGVTDEELARARTRARAALVGELADNTNLGIALATARVLDGDWRAVFNRLDALQRVSAADVQRVARETFRPANRTVAILRNVVQS